MDILKKAGTNSNQKQVIQFTDLEHARKRAEMYMGGLKPIDCQLFKLVKVGSSESLLQHYKELFSPAASKLVDEILSNCIDEYTENGKSNIYLSFDKKTGQCIVKNDGSCVPLTVSKDQNGVEMPTPELCFGYFKSSSNFFKEDNKKEDAKGGMNGLGASLTNAFCVYFKVHILDAVQGIEYTQIWEDCMQKKSEPEVNKLTLKKYPKAKRKQENSYTEITFDLNWKDFGINIKKNKEIMSSLEDWIKFRMYQTNVYCDSDIYYNGTIVSEFSDMNSIVESVIKYYLATESNDKIDMKKFITTTSFTIKPDDNEYEWDVAIGVKPGGDKWGYEQISIVNGLWVMNGGIHMDHLSKQIGDYVKPFMEKMYKSNKKITLAHIKPYLVIGMCGKISDPKFDGQRKDHLCYPAIKYFKSYVIPVKHLKKIWTAIKPFIQIQLAVNDFKDGEKEETTEVITTTKGIKKYIPAEGAHKSKRGKNLYNRGLIISEGDSANGMIELGLRDSNVPNVSFKNYGTFNIQGVPMNARRAIDIRVNPISGKRIAVRKDKLKSNERYSSLVKVLGLDYGKIYTKYNLPELNYQCIIISTDQDHHGKGLIKTQLIDFFSLFWPSLVKIGFVKFLITPAVRCFDRKGKKPIKEFYSDREYDKWETSQGVSYSRLKQLWKIKYYKGLGSHDNQETRRIFKKWDKNIMTIDYDKYAERNLKAFLGESAAPRKVVLSTPVTKSEQDYYTDANTVSITAHTHTDTKSYQLYDIATRIPSFIDGLVITRRKILAACRNQFGIKDHDETKVPVITGIVMEKMEYHHGDAALSEVILKQAQSFTGAKLFPFLKGMCNIGSRHHGGCDVVSPRYGFVKFNTMLCKYLYCPNDDWALNYNVTEGTQVEPIYFIPILPMTLLENNKMPAHGWQNTTWARDYDEVVWYLLKCIDAGVCQNFGENAIKKETIDFPKFNPDRSKIDPDGLNPKDDFAVSTFGYSYPKLELVGNEKVLNSIGSYHWDKKDKNKFIITELPFKTWNEHFIDGNPNANNKNKIKGIKDDELVADVVDKSTEKDILIEVTLVEGAREKITEKYDKMKTLKDLDHIIRYFDMKQTLKSNLVFLSQNGAVQVYDRYMEIFKNWYFVRQKCYYDRIMRQRIILELKIMRLKNIIRFVENRREYKLEDISEEQQDGVMKTNKFVPLNNAVLNSPKSLTHIEIKRQVLEVDVSYNYLLNMGARAFTDKKLKEYRSQLKNFIDELNELDPESDVFKGQTAWKKELKALDVVVQTARASESGWTYDEPEKVWD